MQKKGLGRGLGALIPAISEGSEKVIQVSVDEIVPNPRQPRRHFNDSSIAELANSIAEHGVIQPIIVRQASAGYELVAGERRLRAAKAAGLEKIPAIVRNSTDLKSLEIALIENIQRENLNPVDEAHAYHRLIEEFSLTQDELAVKVGKSRSAVANSLRLLNLSLPVRELLLDGILTAGHARAILSVGDEEKQLELAKSVVSGGLSVRQTESLAKNFASSSGKAVSSKSSVTEDEEAADHIGRTIGALVRVKVAKAGRGKIEIHFGSLEELDRLRRRLAADSLLSIGAVEHS